jgi:hypothetical protein
MAADQNRWTAGDDPLNRTLVLPIDGSVSCKGAWLFFMQVMKIGHYIIAI